MSASAENPFLKGAPIPASYTAETASAFLRRVFGLMAFAMALTASTAFLIPAIAPIGSELFLTLFGSPLRWVITLAPLAFVLVLSFGIHRMNSLVATGVFFAYALVMGVSLSFTFYIYTQASLLVAFVSAGGLFAALTVFGLFTKIDLSRFRNILMISLGVLVVASIASWFITHDGFQTAVAAAGVVIFAGLTAYDVQNIKLYGAAAEMGESRSKMAIMGALNLYLDFLNLFLFLLRLFGGRK
jgi:FtsH-binding integral membrane protein